MLKVKRRRADGNDHRKYQICWIHDWSMEKVFVLIATFSYCWNIFQDDHHVDLANVKHELMFVILVNKWTVLEKHSKRYKLAKWWFICWLNWIHWYFISLKSEFITQSIARHLLSTLDFFFRVYEDDFSSLHSRRCFRNRLEWGDKKRIFHSNKS